MGSEKLFYPDLPKAYQISQYEEPLAIAGEVQLLLPDLSQKNVRINRLHLEEDAAKLVHRGSETWVDFNRSGTPLMEIVTEPDIRSTTEALTLLREVRRLVRYLDVSGADMEKGHLRCDASISLRPKGTSNLYPRTEIKNLNSFRSVAKALKFEIKKQEQQWHEGTPNESETTVLWNPDKEQTEFMRGKEGAADYRYFPDPDIPEVFVDQVAVKAIKDALLVTPMERIKSYVAVGIDYDSAVFIAEDKDLADYIDESLRLASQDDAVMKMWVKWVTSELFKSLKIVPVTSMRCKPKDLVLIIKHLAQFKIIRSVARTIFRKACKQTIDVKALLDAHCLPTDYDVDGLVQKIIKDFFDTAAQYQAGKNKALNVLMGKAIQSAGGKIDPKTIKQTFEKLLPREIDNQNLEKTDTGLTHSVPENAPKNVTGSSHNSPYRTHSIANLSDNDIGQRVTLAGWIQTIRDHGELIFIDLRDSSYEIIQVRVERSKIGKYLSSPLKPETVIQVIGDIIMRESDDFNPQIRTGTVELDIQEITILNAAKSLPFSLKDVEDISEKVRFGHRFLDLRSPAKRQLLINRHQVVQHIRSFLSKERFIEVETPILSAGTDEGAREFVVPSRMHPGSHYTLPQAPQQFKQMLMMSGVDRYFQVAKCFRDEDSRGDRQPEFTQLDMELSFVQTSDVIGLNSRLFESVFAQFYSYKWELKPWTFMPYTQAINKYGTDRPDIRFDLSFSDITDIVRQSKFTVFRRPIEQGGIVKCLKVERKKISQKITKSQIESLTKIAQSHGLGGLAYIIVHPDQLQSPIIKYLGEEVAQQIVEKMKAENGDVIFFAAAESSVVNQALDNVRRLLGEMLNLIDPNILAPVWVIDFPLFEPTDEGGWTFSHNPFSKPQDQYLEDHLNGRNIGGILAEQYDFVINGHEIGGGSIRAHQPEVLAATYRNMGKTSAQMLKSIGTVYEALQYGAPPHGGIAWGLDRLMMILERQASIREVMAFPKTGSGEDLLFGSPSVLTI